MRLAYFAALGDDGSILTDSNTPDMGTVSTLTDSNQGDGGTLPPPVYSDPFGLGSLQPATSTDLFGGGVSTSPNPPPAASYGPAPVTTGPYNPGVSAPPLVQAPQSNSPLSTSSSGLFPGFLTGPGGFLMPSSAASQQSGMSTTTIALIVLGAAALAIALLKGRPA